MQIILVSRHLKVAKTLTIMPRHLAFAAAGLCLFLCVAVAGLTWLGLKFRLPPVEPVLQSAVRDAEAARAQSEAQRAQVLMTRLGELKAQLLQLDALGERVAGALGVRREGAARRPGQGGPYLPLPMNADELAREVERLSRAVEQQEDELSLYQARLLAQKVRDRRLPTSLPVEQAVLGSPFGHREDPIMGLRARHEGIDFNAEPGTPVKAAAEGVVVSASRHPDFGNLVELDHGDGLLTRYAHLSRMDVAAGALIRRGQVIGAVGNTGRSTGPHLHFEVRLGGVAQNPAHFLRQNPAYAAIQHRSGRTTP